MDRLKCAGESDSDSDSTYISHSQRPSLHISSTNSGNFSAGNNLTIHNQVVNHVCQDKGNDRDIQKVASWLFDISTVNYHMIQKETYEKVVKDTCLWILDLPRFRDWVAHPCGTLWGIGIPGAGKTVLTSFVINHLQNIPNAVVIYTYCRFNDNLTSTKILALLLRQLVESSQAAFQYVFDTLYLPLSAKQSLPTFSELLASIRTALSLVKQVYIVVDALDELQDEEREALVGISLAFRQPIFVTSRELSLSCLPDGPGVIIKAPIESFRTFVSHELGKLPKLTSLLDKKRDVLEEIIEQILAKSDGMFLLATLQLMALKGVTTIKNLRKSIERLPNTLSNIYDLNLARISAQSEEERTLAYSALLWVTHASRPLTVVELLSALSIDEESEEIDPEALTSESTLVSVCCGLLTVERESRIVRLIHYTAYDFFLCWKGTPFGKPHVFTATICAVYLTHCIIDRRKIASRDQLEGVAKEYPFVVYSCSNLGFHAHRAVDECHGTLPIAVTRYLQVFPSIPLPWSPGIIDWEGRDFDRVTIAHFGALHGLIPLLETCTRSTELSDLGCSPLFYASMGGHISFAERCLLAPNVNVNSRNRLGYTALCTAVEHNREGIVALLLKAGANIAEQTTSFHWTVLHVAAQNGNENIVRLLLEHSCIDVNQQDIFRRTPLHLACKMGHVKVISLLLERTGTTVNAEDINGRTALHHASKNGHVGAVEKLLAISTVDPNVADKSNATPIHMACENGHVSVVRLLLRAPTIQIDAKATSRRTPLYLAFLHGHHRIIELLISSPGIDLDFFCSGISADLETELRKGHDTLANSCRYLPKDIKHNLLLSSIRFGLPLLNRHILSFPDVDVNWRDQEGKTHLHWALANLRGLDSNHPIIDSILTLPSIDVRIQDHQGWSPLHVASYYGPSSVVEKLLQNPRVDVNVCNLLGQTPLHVSLRACRDTVTGLLLERSDINLNIRCASGGLTELHVALRFSSDTSVRLLLAQRTIGVNMPTSNGFTALHFAIRRGQLSLVQELLSFRSIDVNARCIDGWTPLHFAVAHNHRLLVCLLLDLDNIEVNACGKDNMTPLHLASSFGLTSIMKILLTHPGINTKVKNSNYHTALHLASLNGHPETVTHLLRLSDSEELINLPDKSGKTALHLALDAGRTEIGRLLIDCPYINASEDVVDRWIASVWDPDLSNSAPEEAMEEEERYIHSLFFSS